MATSNDADELHFGSVIVSFQCVVLALAPDEASNDAAVGYVFSLVSGPPRIVKFTATFLPEFISSLKASIARYPDERERLARQIEESSFTQAELARLRSTHPIFQYLTNIPTIPDKIRRPSERHYVKFAHISASVDYFKFDLTFFSGATTRLSMPTSVVPYFLETLIDTGVDFAAARKNRNLS